VTVRSSLDESSVWESSAEPGGAADDEAPGKRMAEGGMTIRDSLRKSLGGYLTREAVSLALLAGLAVVCFLGVTVLSRLYHTQQESLGSRWFNRGVVDLKAQRFDRAVIEFRAALVYARDDYAYQLNLAKALLGTKRSAEAYAYLINLWEREPEDGLVNLELARIAAQREQTQQALRYYHNAIYATWTDDASQATSGDLASKRTVDVEEQRRETRLELIEFLLRMNVKTQAQSELIALEENVGDDAAEQAHVGDLFIRAQEYEHALEAYRASLKLNPRDSPALAGAGRAAFELGRYDLAREYLQTAVNTNSSDAQSAQRLKTAELVLRMDPFRAGISAAQREQAVMEAFVAAGERLKSCSANTSVETGLGADWAKLKPQVTALGMRRNPDVAQKAMDLVFNIERQTSAGCGTPAETDAALLLIAKLHEGN
jgi:tetratricopeptide (TPR) repeat protein